MSLIRGMEAILAGMPGTTEITDTEGITGGIRDTAEINGDMQDTAGTRGNNHAMVDICGLKPMCRVHLVS
ncbi:hypothetical protein GL2_18270 [Microbulbifer sp. GL-2]|nr:hypothetical protein GL2_18270 [Microbulbifer sp. GL-2]